MDKIQDRLGRYEVLARVIGLDRFIAEYREGKGRRDDEGGLPTLSAREFDEEYRRMMEMVRRPELPPRPHPDRP